MQQSPGPGTDSSHATPFSTPLPSTDEQLLSPLANITPSEIDPLITQAAERLAAAINDFKRALDTRDSSSASVKGSIDIFINTENPQTYTLSLVHDLEGEEHPISVRITNKEHSTTNGQSRAGPNATAKAHAAVRPYKPARRESDAGLEQDIIPRRKRKIDGDGGDNLDDDTSGRKRVRMGDDVSEDIMQLISKGDLEELLAKQRDDIQEDTTDCVNHVQKLLRRWKEQWDEKNDWECDQFSHLASQQGIATRINAVDLSQSMPTSAADVFATPENDEATGPVNLPDLIRKESRQISKQIRWVEECRRIAADSHDQREETWRGSSATFHDKNRQNREIFEKRLIHESAAQGNLLNQILSEIKALASVTYSLKWETPAQFSPPYPVPPANPFTDQHAHPQGQPQGQGRGGTRRP
ncbi:hypothetical protein K432DRAFT_399595 [Lepidopterella palustris CBS 459.81]|uniref:Uncharacterized protein n=1 Tax=Lepidopterella palustris CBS 459.81 TaxID=1314670 RepID=A0A8E2JL98_9PEZI|nr:hypothetical protein K432DRAFT_399595 [Lepidopterella palustris CBS 459.81]